MDRLYPGKVQLDRSLQELVRSTEDVLGLDEEKRPSTILRFDSEIIRSPGFTSYG